MERLTEKGKTGADLIGLESIMNILTDKEQDRLIAALNKLADCEDAEENGTRIKLPCKVGDTVYAIMLNDDEEKEVVLLQIDRFLVYENNEVEIEAYIPSNIAVWDGFTIDIKNIGKTVFLAREEAEKALKERSDEQNT